MKMKINRKIIIGCVIFIFILFQLIPWKHAALNMFKTQKDILTSYGAPFNFLSFHTVNIIATNKTEHLGSVHSLSALAIDAGIIIVAGLILWGLLKGEKHRNYRLAASGLIIFLFLGGALFFARYPTQWRDARTAHRIEFSHNAIKYVKTWAADKEWIDKQKEIIKQQEADKGFWGPRITKHFMLLKNDEWFVFYQGESKTDNSIDDILIMKGSDGKWYFTDTHICVDMFQFRMYDAPLYENLNAVTNETDFKLEPYMDENKLFERSRLYRH